MGNKYGSNKTKSVEGNINKLLLCGVVYSESENKILDMWHFDTRPLEERNVFGLLNLWHIIDWYVAIQRKLKISI